MHVKEGFNASYRSPEGTDPWGLSPLGLKKHTGLREIADGYKHRIFIHFDIGISPFTQYFLRLEF